MPPCVVTSSLLFSECVLGVSGLPRGPRWPLSVEGRRGHWLLGGTDVASQRLAALGPRKLGRVSKS